MNTPIVDTEAVRKIAFYRERHKITAGYRAAGPLYDAPAGLRVPIEYYCEHDGLRVDVVKNGFRHNQAALFRAQDEAGHVPVGKCRVCNRTYADHIRTEAAGFANHHFAE